jgi:uncharacterized membrane protein
MNRKELDAFADHYGLTAEGVESAFALAAARPSGADIRRFGVRMLHLAGVLSLAAGVVFWVAANWSALAVLGRFALVQAVLVAAVAVALWRPPPHAVGRYALLLAFIVTGALFALFGQTYQTGADVYELFLAWALLGVVLVLAAQWSVVWAAWMLVLNVALALFCGARPEAGLFWVAFSGWDLSRSQLLLLPLALNMLLWAAGLALEETRWSRLAPAWLGRLALAFAVAYGTWAAMIVVVRAEGPAGGYAGLLAPLVVFSGVALHTLRRQVDVFPLALIEASLILLSTTAIVRYGDWDDIGVFFVIAAWLVVSSTVAGRYLMRLVREWGTAESQA